MAVDEQLTSGVDIRGMPDEHLIVRQQNLHVLADRGAVLPVFGQQSGPREVASGGTPTLFAPGQCLEK